MSFTDPCTPDRVRGVRVGGVVRTDVCKDDEVGWIGLDVKMGGQGRCKRNREEKEVI